MYFPALLSLVSHLWLPLEYARLYISAWAFGVACLTGLGDARASVRGTSNRTRSHVFFMCSREPITKRNRKSGVGLSN